MDQPKGVENQSATPATPEDHSGTERLKSLADGLFGVVMTLLVLDLKLPGRIEDKDLMTNLFTGEYLNTFFFYVITFLTAGIYWYNHVQIMRRLKFIDQAFFWLNLAFFLFITTLPFTADLFTKDDGSGFNATLIYSGNNAVIGTLLIIVWLYASRGYRLITKEVKPYEIPLTTLRIAVMPTTAALSLVTNLLFGPGVGVAMYYIIPAVMSTAVGIAWGRARRKYEGILAGCRCLLATPFSCIIATRARPLTASAMVWGRITVRPGMRENDGGATGTERQGNDCGSDARQ